MNSFNGINRRDTLKTLLLTGVIATTGLQLSDDEAKAQTSPKVVVWAKPVEANMYDPHTSILGSSWELLHLTYDGLTALDAEMNPIPAIAESWEQASPTNYTFKLRKTAKFSNGREVTVDDVIGSLKRLTDPKTASFFRPQIGKIKSISSSGDGVVDIQLEEANAGLLGALASTMASIIPMKELADGTFDPTKQLLGTGPFRVVSHVQDDHWKLARNEHYWQAGLPFIDELTVRIIPADQSRIAGLRDGSIDVASFEASPDAALLLSGVEGIEIAQNPTTNVFQLCLNAVWDQSPFRDPKLRQAVVLSLDRQKMIDVALGGIGELSSVMAPVFNACDTTKLPFYTRDIEKAKKLVAETGVGALKFTLAIAPMPVFSLLAQIVKENVAELGLEADISVSDEGSFIKKVWVDNPSTFQAAMTWYAGHTDPAMVPLVWNPEVSGFTAGHIPNDPEYNAVLALARRLPADDPARAEALQKVCTKVDEMAIVVPLVTRIDTVVYRKEKFAKFETAHRDGYATTLYGIENAELR